MIIWIASYPKSGNTWVRSFLTSYIFQNDKRFSFDDLDKIRSFPSDDEINYLKIKYQNYNFTHMAENWDFFQKKIIKDKKFIFLKTHNALCNINGNDFTNLENTLGLIYLIRDPRDVLISYSSHLNLSLEDTAKIMSDLNIVEKTKDSLDRTLLSSWSNHYNSWKYFPKDKLIIKYEDLIDKPDLTFLKIVEYLNKLINIKVDKQLISRTIDQVDFEKLKKLESETGFPENRSSNAKHIFFKNGKKNQWKKILSEELKNKFKEIFRNEMLENKYILKN